MAVSSISSSGSTSSSYSNRITGLASNLDTESLVEKLTSATKLKITTAEQQKQVLEWKRDFYQEVTSKLTTFQDKYFGSSFNSLSINDSLKQLTVTSPSSSYVQVNPGTSATQADVFISDIVSLASSAKLQSSSSVTASPLMNIDTSKLSELSGKKLNVTLDGTTKTLTFADKTYGDSLSVQQELQSMLNSAFGQGRISVSLSGDSLTLDSSGSKIVLNNSGTEGSEASGILGFSDGESNRLNLNAVISQSGLKNDVSSNGNIGFTINDVTFSFSSNTTLGVIMDAVNKSSAGVTMSYSNISDTFTLTSSETGSSSKIDVSDTQGSLLNTILGGTGRLTSGTDAVIKISTNGSTADADLTTITRSSNTFDIDGASYTLLGKAAGDTKEEVTVTVGTDTDAIVDKIKEFVSDYNDLQSYLNGKLSETVYKDYQPLTDDEKEKLSTTQQDQWTEKAKSGLLRNDSYLKDIVNNLRSSLYSDVKQVGTSTSIGTMLADIGITTGTYTENGQLHINESQLKKSVSENPDKVLQLFTQKASLNYSQYATSDQKKTRYQEAGIFWRMSDIIKDNTNKVGAKGKLVELAGSPEDNSYTSDSIYSKKISDMSDRITTLNDQLTMEENRYWAQFTAMETAINNLNSQSAWLSQQTSSLSS